MLLTGVMEPEDGGKTAALKWHNNERYHVRPQRRPAHKDGLLLLSGRKGVRVDLERALMVHATVGTLCPGMQPSVAQAGADVEQLPTSKPCRPRSVYSDNAPPNTYYFGYVCTSAPQNWDLVFLTMERTVVFQSKA